MNSVIACTTMATKEIQNSNHILRMLYFVHQQNINLLYSTLDYYFVLFTTCNYLSQFIFNVYPEKPWDEYPKVAKSTKSTKMRLQENET